MTIFPILNKLKKREWNPQLKTEVEILHQSVHSLIDAIRDYDRSRKRVTMAVNDKNEGQIVACIRIQQDHYNKLLRIARRFDGA